MNNLRFRNLILIDTFATLIAALLYGLYKGYSAALIPLFLGFLAGIIIIRFFAPNRGYQRLEQAERERFDRFRERLAAEGVVDETGDIARARRIAWWWSKKKHSELLSSHVKEFAEVVTYSGKTYVIHRQTLNILLAKLPINDQGFNKLTQPEQRIFEVLRSTGKITFGENKEWSKQNA